MNERLIALPTSEEIKKAIQSTHPDKAPGPDGFSAGFYTANWETVGTDLIKEIQSFFQGKLLTKSLNHTLVRLIPKKLSAKQMVDYRPIALCNVFYKFIAKILANRLQPLLRDIISENQSAFVPGRAISDNVLITHEVLHFLKNSEAKRYCFMAVKTDMSKAYDRLEWSFIQKVLEGFGFHPQWISWLIQCISTVSYSYIINGETRGKVIPSRGIRQGDPLSPYIFILCSEVLSGLCKSAEEKGCLKGIKIARKCPRINHLLFADDTMFFCRADKKNCKELMDLLQKYEKASGQKINTSKSSVFFSSKTPANLKEVVKRTLGIEKEGGTGKYLGLPELFGQKKNDLFASILEKIKTKVKGWSTRFLSHAGKMTLLKAVLASIPSYAMSCFKLPGNLCKRIQSLLTRFWWDTKQNKKKMAWISWKKMATPKAQGGLGYKEIQQFNDALLAKLSWRILQNPSSLLSKQVLNKYCHDTQFLESKGPSNASHGWRGVLLGKDLLLPNLIKTIGNGEDTNLWSEPWIPTIPGYKPFGPPSQVSQNLKVVDLFNESKNDWDKEKIELLFPHLLQDILLIRIPLSAPKDIYHWKPTKSGQYSTKSGYFSTSEGKKDLPVNAFVSPNFNWYKQVWNLKCAPKIKTFMWKALNEALPTGENCSKRNLAGDQGCKRCGEVESTYHILFDCWFAKRAWSLVNWKVAPPISPLTAQKCVEATFTNYQKSSCLPPYGITTTTPYPWIIWNLWKARNSWIFQDESLNPIDLITKSLVEAREWEASQADPVRNPNLFSSKAHPSEPNCRTTIWTDAAWKSEDKIASLAVILQNNETMTKQSFTCIKENVSSAVQAEGLAILEAIFIASAQQLQNLRILSDSKESIEALKASDHCGLHGILSDFHHFSKQFEMVSIDFIPRSANVFADSIAKCSLASFWAEKDFNISVCG